MRSEQMKKVKSKVAAKEGLPSYRWNIMKRLGIPEDEIEKFAESKHWLQYFPPRARNDMTALGCRVRTLYIHVACTCTCGM